MLLKRLVALPPSSSEPDAHSQLAQELTSAEFEPLQKRPLVLPGHKECDWWHEAMAMSEKLLPGYGASAIRQLIFGPVRIYERLAPENYRALTLLTSVEAGTIRRVLHGVLDVPVHDGKPTGYGTFRLDAVDLADAEAVHLLLARVAPELSPGSMYHHPEGQATTAMFVGKLSRDEEAAIRWHLWARGIHLKPYLGEPNRRRRATEKAIEKFDGDIAIFVWSRCDRSAGDLRKRLDDGRATVIDLGEASGDALALECWLEVDQVLPDDLVDGIAVTSLPAPELKWSDVEATAKRLNQEQLEDGTRDPSFCLCEEAWNDLKRNDFLYPGWMEDSLIRLFRLATGYREGAVSGDFPTWAREQEDLEIVMKDIGLSVHKPQLIKCCFEGTEYIAEAHVKLQRARWVPRRENGRIYFALDSKNRRLIVHHIGLKLG